LAKDKKIERKLEEEKIEIKARKALAREKRERANKEWTPISSYNIPHEKVLKKISTRGVVKLFNALQQHHGGDSVSTSAPKRAKKDSGMRPPFFFLLFFSDRANINLNIMVVSQLSKTGFLDMLKSSGSDKKTAMAASKVGSSLFTEHYFAPSSSLFLHFRPPGQRGTRSRMTI